MKKLRIVSLIFLATTAFAQNQVIGVNAKTPQFQSLAQTETLTNGVNHTDLKEKTSSFQLK